jgi:hypothetical protein
MTPEQIRAHFPRANRSLLEANGAVTLPVFEDEPTKPAAPKLRQGPKMNNTEADFGRILEARKARGEVIEYAFEPFSLRYGDNAFYKPDWVARTGGNVSIESLAKLCSLHVIDIYADRDLLSDYQSLTDSVELKHFTIYEVKGAFIYPEAKPRFKAAKLRHGWADWEMWQRKKGDWTRIL